MPENPQILGCRFLDALVLIRGFLLYSTLVFIQIGLFTLIMQVLKKFDCDLICLDSDVGVSSRYFLWVFG